jgi:molecular chaperone DnaK (HSP70)
MNYNICIDFGTCNSVISYIEDGILKQIQDDITGDILIPTTIYFINSEIKINKKFIEFEPDLDYLIGNASIDLVNCNKDWANYFFQFKRFLGITSKSVNSYKDFLLRYNLEYTTDEDTIYFYIQTSNDSDYKIKFSICDLIRLFFKALKKILINKLNLKEINNLITIPIILTCPAYFHDLQRSQLKRAAELAGFEIFKLINEPTAAAVFYINKYSKLTNSDKYIIYDLGGGTIDTTVVEYYNDLNICEVIDIDGNNSLGGIDIDNILTYDIISRYSIDKTNNKWLNKIKIYAEEIKIKLTYTNNIDLYFENVPVIKNNTIEILDSIKVSYSRHLFNNLINELVDDMIKPIIIFSKKYDNINNIIFIGGPTQIPLLQSKVNTLLDINSITFGINDCVNLISSSNIIA